MRCTSNRLTPIVRRKASRTAANASKTSSSTGSPFSIRCLNSTVLPASSASERPSNSGSSEPM